jgi:hypothetical protein
VTDVVVIGTLSDWHMIASDDLNSDGKDDILLEHPTNGNRVLWMMSNGAVEGAALLGTLPTEWHISATTDIDGDAFSDILLENHSDGARAAWLEDGHGGVTSAPLLTYLDTKWHMAAALVPDRNVGRVNHVVINEVDYDQIGVDTEEFVELFNPTDVALDLQGLALVLINGSTRVEYSRVTLQGTLGPGQYAVVGSTNVQRHVPETALFFALPVASDGIQNGSPDGVALVNTTTQSLIDALSYEGAITMATINGFPGTWNLVEGTALGIGVADSNTSRASLIRFPNGIDTNDAASDWRLTGNVTAGSANLCCP